MSHSHSMYDRDCDFADLCARLEFGDLSPNEFRRRAMHEHGRDEIEIDQLLFEAGRLEIP